MLHHTADLASAICPLLSIWDRIWGTNRRIQACNLCVWLLHIRQTDTDRQTHRRIQACNLCVWLLHIRQTDTYWPLDRHVAYNDTHVYIQTYTASWGIREGEYSRGAEGTCLGLRPRRQHLEQNRQQRRPSILSLSLSLSLRAHVRDVRVAFKGVHTADVNKANNDVYIFEPNKHFVW
jgi:hypothetical protein